MKLTRQQIEENREWKEDRREKVRKAHKQDMKFSYVCEDCGESYDANYKIKKCIFCKSKNLS